MVELQMIPVERITPNQFQPRENFDREVLEGLASSMNNLSLLQPLVVRPYRDVYEIACGERRWRAAKILGWEEVPAVVEEMDDQKLQLYSLVENVHRLDLSSREKEKAVYDLWVKHYKDKGRSMAGLARDLGFSADWVGDLISAYQERKGLDKDTSAAVSTYDLQVTRGIEEPVRKELLERKARGDFAQKDLEEITPIVREAPPEKRKTIVEETAKDIGEARRIVKEEAKAFAKGEMEARDIRVQLGADERRLNRVREISNKVRYWTVASVEMIENVRLRRKAIDHIQETRDHCDHLLEQLKRRDWYAG